MWLRKPTQEEKNEAAERLRYGRYYEHDGALRAYANRAMLLAFISAPTALIAVGMAAYVRLQPATVIRIDGREGAAPPRGPLSAIVVASQSGNEDAAAFERKAFVRLFLDRYLNFSAASVGQNWSDSLNMMTTNLRRSALAAMERDDEVGRIRDQQITSVFHLRSLEASRDDPLTFTAYGVKEVHRLRERRETSERIVGEFHLRLLPEKRSEENPSGLLIADYAERLIEGEHRDPQPQGASSSPVH
jgi:hypothetical protein